MGLMQGGDYLSEMNHDSLNQYRAQYQSQLGMLGLSGLNNAARPVEKEAISNPVILLLEE